MSVTMEDLFEAGCHLGHPAQKWHPKMKPWIYGEQDGIHLFDLEKTSAQLEKADAYVRDLKATNKSLVVVATKKQAAELAEKLAAEYGAMYVINRWPGGLITNWEQVRRSIRRMNEIEDGLKSGKFKEYTKYERLMMEKELARLERLFGGLKNLKAKPDVLLVVDAQKEKNCVKEAMTEKIPVVALIDSNTDPTGITLPIPGNDDALSSVTLILTEVLRAYGEGEKKNVPKEKEEPEKKAEVKEEGKKEAAPVKVETEVEKEKTVTSVKSEKKDEKKTTTVEKKVKVVEKKASVKKTAEKKVVEPAAKKVAKKEVKVKKDEPTTKAKKVTTAKKSVKTKTKKEA